MKTKEEIEARQAAIATELRELNEKIGDGEPTEEQSARWTELDTEHETNAADLDKLVRSANVAESRSKWKSQRFGKPADDNSDVDVRSAAPGDVISRAQHLLDDKRDDSAHLNAEQRAAVDKLLRTNTGDMQGHKLARMALATERPAYRSAFRKLISRGGNAYLQPEEARAVQDVEELRTALQITADANGGFAVPVLIDPTVVLTGGGTPNDFFDISRVEQITTDEWKGLTSAGATWYWTTEGVASTDGAPVLAQPTVTTKKITGWVPFSVEIQGDWPGFAQEMSTILGESYNEAVVSALTNGPGNAAQPWGIVNALEANTAVQVLVSTDGLLYAADVYKLWKALPTKYRRTASWMASTGVENAIRQFGGAAGDPNFTVNIGEDGIGRLFGRPFYENDYMDDVATLSTSDSSLLIVGDFRNYLIAQRVGMTVELVQHVQNSGVPTGQRGMWAWARLGADSINDNAFRLLTND